MKTFYQTSILSVKGSRSVTKIESFILEFKSDVEEKRHVEIEFVKLEFHREEKKNEEGNPTEQRRRNP